MSNAQSPSTGPRWSPDNHAAEVAPLDEGGLRAPPHLKGWRKAWWWFDFLILVKLARLRFIAILVAIGAVITQWDLLAAYYDKWTRPSGDVHAAVSDVEWFCPMHPAVVRDNPKDKCPICFMPLSKRKKGTSTDEALPAGIVNRVQLSPYRVVLAGVRTWRVDYQPLHKEIMAVGFVEFNERGLKNISARVKGRIDTLNVNETGQMVEAGDVLASLYSPELNVTVQNLVDAKKRNSPELMAGARHRLELLGISTDQIDEIVKTGKANSHLRIRTPISGHVIKKYVREGQYVDEGMPLYDIADLSSVWIQAQVYEEDLGFLPVEQEHKHAAGPDSLPITATTRAFPGEIFHGRLAFVYPHVDQESRTVSVRFELNNPGHKLRPGMTANVQLDIPPSNLRFLTDAAASSDPAVRAEKLEQGLVLAVPETSVIDTGSQTIVYRESLPGTFEGVLVRLGPKMKGPGDVTFYPVLAGLDPGDRVVTSGSFLVDAETRLNPAAGSIYFGGSGGKGGGNVTTVRPSTPEDADAKTIAALAQLSDADRAIATAQQFCPILPESRLGSMGVPVKVVLDGQTAFVCCSGCTKEALANPQETLAKLAQARSPAASSLPASNAVTASPATKPDASPPPKKDPEAKIAKALAKLSETDRAAAEKQRFCPVLPDSRLGSMGTPIKLDIKGQTVFLCCEGCREEALVNSALTLQKVEKVSERR